MPIRLRDLLRQIAAEHECFSPPSLMQSAIFIGSRIYKADQPMMGYVSLEAEKENRAKAKFTIGGAIPGQPPPARYFLVVTVDSMTDGQQYPKCPAPPQRPAAQLSFADHRSGRKLRIGLELKSRSTGERSHARVLLSEKATEISVYTHLIEEFLNETLSPVAFETAYLDTFKKDQGSHPEAEYEILNDLFGNVDAFCADPSLRGPRHLDEDQLRTEAQKALSALRRLRQVA